MRRTAIICTAVAAAALLVSPAPAQAADSAVASPNPIVVYGSRSTWATFKIDLRGSEKMFDVFVTLKASTGTDGSFVTVYDNDGDGVWTGRTTFGACNEPGRWRIETLGIAQNGGGEVPGPTGSFTVRAATKLSAKASPAAVRKGKAVRVSGRLLAAQLCGNSGFEAKWVKVYFRAKGAKKWSYKGKAKTNYDGRFSKAFKATRSGSWQARWSGPAKYVPSTSKAWYVRVR